MKETPTRTIVLVVIAVVLLLGAAAGAVWWFAPRTPDNVTAPTEVDSQLEDVLGQIYSAKFTTTVGTSFGESKYEGSFTRDRTALNGQSRLGADCVEEGRAISGLGEGKSWSIGTQWNHYTSPGSDALIAAYLPLMPAEFAVGKPGLCASFSVLPLVQTTTSNQLGEVSSQWNEAALSAMERSRLWEDVQEMSPNAIGQRDLFDRGVSSVSWQVEGAVYTWSLSESGQLEKLTVIQGGRIMAEYLFSDVKYGSLQ